MPQLSTLSFERASVSGEVDWATYFWDYLIDGTSLSERVPEDDFCEASPFGWPSGEPANGADIRAQLLLEMPAYTTSGRVPIYICPLCGDLDCGALVAKIEIDGGIVRWSEFSYDRETLELPSPPEIWDGSTMADIYFDEVQYRRALATPWLWTSAGPTRPVGAGPGRFRSLLGRRFGPGT